MYYIGVRRGGYLPDRRTTIETILAFDSTTYRTATSCYRTLLQKFLNGCTARDLYPAGYDHEDVMEDVRDWLDQELVWGTVVPDGASPAWTPERYETLEAFTVGSLALRIREALEREP